MNVHYLDESDDLDDGFLGLFRLPVGVVLPLLVGLGMRVPAVEVRAGVCDG